MNALPLLWLSLSFIFGLILACFVTFPVQVIILIIILGIVFSLLELILARQNSFIANRKRFCPLPLGILISILSIGLLRFQTAQPILTPHDLAWYNDGGQIEIIGTVIAPPVPGDHFAQVRLQAEEFMVDSQSQPANSMAPISGLVLLWVPNQNHLEYGDRLQVTGRLVTPMENADFSYKDYLSRQGINSLMMYPETIVIETGAGSPVIAAVFHFREIAYQTLNQLFPKPESSFLSGILLGLPKDIPDSLYKAYQATGTAHILVISGFNIAIIAAAVSRLLKRFLPYGWDVAVSIFVIALYTIMVGAQSPVVRAAIMGCLALPAYLLGRRLIGIHTLTLTAAIMLIFNPLLIQDVSFQLTFLATLGIVCFTEPMQNGLLNFARRYFKEETIQRWYPLFADVLLVTLAAQIATLPVIFYQFGYISSVSLLANLLILPFQPMVEILGGLAVLSGMVIHPLGQVLAYLAWLPSAYTNHMVVFLGGLPNILITTSRSWVWATSILLTAALLPAIRFQFTPHKSLPDR